MNLATCWPGRTLLYPDIIIMQLKLVSAEAFLALEVMGSLQVEQPRGQSSVSVLRQLEEPRLVEA